MTNTAQTMSGIPVATLAVEWGTYQTVFGGTIRTYPACRTESGEVLRAQKSEGSKTWVAARRGTFYAYTERPDHE